MNHLNKFLYYFDFILKNTKKKKRKMKNEKKKNEN